MYSSPAIGIDGTVYVGSSETLPGRQEGYLYAIR